MTTNLFRSNHFLILVICFTVGGISGTDVKDLAHRFFLYQCEISSSYASSTCNGGINTGFFNYSFENFDKVQERISEFHEEAIQAEAENRADQLTLTVLRSTLESFKNGSKYLEYGMLNPLSFLDGIHVDYVYFTSGNVNRSKDALDALLERYSNLPQHIDQIITLMKRAVDLRRTNHLFSMRGVEERIDLLTKSENVSSHPFFKPFANNLQYENDFEREEYMTKGRESIDQYIVPSFTKLKDYVQVYMRHLRPEIGVTTLDGGREYYQQLIRYYTSVPDLTPERIYEIGLEQVGKIKSQMEEVMNEVGFSGTLTEFIESLKNDTRFYLNSSEELLARYRHIVFQVIEPRLPRIIKFFPDYDLEVRPTQTADELGGLYFSPDANGTRPGYFQVNVFEPETKPIFEMLALSLHESSPGHHLQIATKLSQKDLPSVRRYGTAISNRWFAPFGFPSYTSYTEGWGLYSEELGFDMDLFSDPYDRLGRYSYDMFRRHKDERT